MLLGLKQLNMSFFSERFNVFVTSCKITVKALKQHTALACFQVMKAASCLSWSSCLPRLVHLVDTYTVDVKPMFLGYKITA